MKHIDVRNGIQNAISLADDAASIADEVSDENMLHTFVNHDWSTLREATDTLSIYIDGERWHIKITRPRNQDMP